MRIIGTSIADGMKISCKILTSCHKHLKTTLTCTINSSDARQVLSDMFLIL